MIGLNWRRRRQMRQLADLVLGKDEDELPRFDLGLGMRNGKLLYRGKGGFGGWLPMIVRAAIVAAWNPIACRIMGHDKFDERPFGGKHVVCTDCCKEWK